MIAEIFFWFLVVKESKTLTCPLFWESQDSLLSSGKPYHASIDSHLSSLPVNQGSTAIFELPQCLSTSPGDENDRIQSRPFHDVLVGDKRGNARILRFNLEDDGSIAGAATLISELSHGPALPVFSLAAEQETETLFVGGGDRYVSVWQKQQSNGELVWNRVQRLGPHTGWVKAIATSEERRRNASPKIYSIGCNRIESWEYSRLNRNNNSDERVVWRHFDTVSIDSSPTKGAACTLSSDLLCLAQCCCTSTSTSQTGTYQNSTVRIMAAGGVDGRIHFFWNDDENDGKLKPANVVSAHKGRINALHFDPAQQLLFSVSHDGSLHCWSLAILDQSAGGRQHHELVVSRVASHCFGEDYRITALHCWREHSNADPKDRTVICIAAGTHNGCVYLLTLRPVDSRSRVAFEFGLFRDIQIAAEDDPPVITSLCALQLPSGYNKAIGVNLLVGHSQGFGIVSHFSPGNHSEYHEILLAC